MFRLRHQICKNKNLNNTRKKQISKDKKQPFKTRKNFKQIPHL